MIVGKLNLACSEGHRFYAPRPDYWVGRTCYRSNPDSARTHGCQAILRKLPKSTMPPS